MYIPVTDKNSIRLIGRFAIIENGFDFKSETEAITTCPGSIIEMSFKGTYAILHFDTVFNVDPAPHLWIKVDGGAAVECPVDKYLRIHADTDDIHQVEIIFKSSSEEYSRWHRRLVSKIGFCGFEAEQGGQLPENNKKTIEFLGDSITEGVLLDEDYRKTLLADTETYRRAMGVYQNRQEDQYNRVYQDDAASTYAFLTAKKLSLNPRIMAYGGLGVTREANGGVPPAPFAYPYYFDGMPIDYAPADYIVMNYGTNDRWTKDKSSVINEYVKLMDIVRNYNPKAKLIVLSPFCGAFSEEFRIMVAGYNSRNNTDIIFIDGSGIIPPDPIHPTREGHKILAEKLYVILNDKFKVR